MSYDPLDLITPAEYETALIVPPRRGRPSKRDELLGFIAAAGLDRAEYEHLLDDQPPAAPPPLQEAVPETPAEMRDAFLALIWQQRATLKGTALVQALTALSKLAQIAQDTRPDDAGLQVDVLDLIQTEGLLPERKRQMLDQERERAVTRLARIDTELEAL